MKRSIVVLVALVGVLPHAQAMEGKSGEAEQALSASGGIVSPGGPTAVFQNPAGLVQNPDFAVTLQAGAADSFRDPFFRGGLIGGGGNFKGTLGVTQTTTSPSSTSLFYGMGISASGFGFGLSGTTGLSNAGGTAINAGVLYQGSLPVRLGGTVIGINNGVNEWGLGIAGKAGPVELLLDGAYNPGTENFGLKPGLKVGTGDVAVSVSYGFLDAEGTSQLSDGFTAGVGFKVKSATIQLYYNEFATFYAAGTIAI